MGTKTFLNLYTELKTKNVCGSAPASTMAMRVPRFEWYRGYSSRGRRSCTRIKSPVSGAWASARVRAPTGVPWSQRQEDSASWRARGDTQTTRRCCNRDVLLAQIYLE